MKKTACAIMLLSFAACRHARTIDTARGEEATRTSTRAAPRPPPEPGRPTLARSPGELMAPGGAEKIQKALVDKGFLEQAQATGELDTKTSAALRKFQESEQLAKTGAPDRETLARLGINPNDVYRSTENAQHSAQ